MYVFDSDLIPTEHQKVKMPGSNAVFNAAKRTLILNGPNIISTLYLNTSPKMRKCQYCCFNVHFFQTVKCFSGSLSQYQYIFSSPHIVHISSPLSPVHKHKIRTCYTHHTYTLNTIPTQNSHRFHKLAKVHVHMQCLYLRYGMSLDQTRLDLII
jgi:hypothetical protein